MIQESSKPRWGYRVALAIGIVGALGQAQWLWHTLVNSYPYKMMSFPSGRFYAGIGYTGLLVAPVLAIVALKLLKPARLWLVPAVPVVLCPMFFWGVYQAAFLLREMKGNVQVGRNYDGKTPAMVEQEFASLALSLSSAGLCVGLVCGLVLWLLFKTKQKPKDNQNTNNSSLFRPEIQ